MGKIFTGGTRKELLTRQMRTQKEADGGAMDRWKSETKMIKSIPLLAITLLCTSTVLHS